MTNFLDEIRTRALKRVSDMGIVIDQRPTPLGINFLDIFEENKPVIIAEVKFASPSRGDIYKGKLDATQIAESYLKNGASALSILTEPEYFKGNIKYIKDVRNANPKCHILLKDFVLDKKQILEAYNYGVNAVLLIATFLNSEELNLLHNYTLDLGLTPLVEIHTVEEWKAVKPMGPKLIGINNRDLKSMKIDLEISRKLIKKIKEDGATCKILCASAIDNAETMKEMIELGFDGFLIGSIFMESEDPGVALGKMIKESK